MISEDALEIFYRVGKLRDAIYQPDVEPRAQVFELQPGDCIYMPMGSPHAAVTGDDITATFSLLMNTRSSYDLAYLAASARSLGVPLGHDRWQTPFVVDRALSGVAAAPAPWAPAAGPLTVTFALAKPPPIGVDIGPFKAIWFRRIELTTSSGTGVPYLFTTSCPASIRSHSIAAPVAAITLTLVSASCSSRN